MDITIIVPTHNEEHNIARTIEALQQHIHQDEKNIEAIVVCDGCTDNTPTVAKKLENDTIRVLDYPENRGKGGAIRHGFEQAKGEHIVFFDAGLDFPTQDIETFYQQLKKHNVDGIIGSKRHRDSKIQYPIKRRIISKAGQVIVRSLFRLPYKDTQVGIKLFHRSVLEAVLPEIKIQHYAFDIELLVLAHAAEFSIQEAPITMQFNDNGSGIRSTTIAKALSDTLRIYKYKRNGRYSITPKRKI